jgi:hypothetical protein
MITAKRYDVKATMYLQRMCKNKLFSEFLGFRSGVNDVPVLTLCDWVLGSHLSHFLTPLTGKFY